jgi:hypothetical protein
MISWCDWWLLMKSFYINMTWRQSNYQWSGSIVAYPHQKISSAKTH